LHCLKARKAKNLAERTSWLIASVATAALHKAVSGIHLVVLNDKESAVYFCNDLENLLGDTDENFHRRHVLFYPTSYKNLTNPKKPTTPMY